MKMTGGILAKEHHKIHMWLRNNYGSPENCFNPKCKTESWRTQWALIEGKTYEKDITHYVPLCGTCHVRYDRLLRGWPDNEEAREVREIINELVSSKIQPV